MTRPGSRGIVGAISLIAFVLGTIIAWRARFVAPFRAGVVNILVQLPRRHGNLAGLTIAFVTDTHVGPHFAATDLEPIVDRLNVIRPDIVLFGGDYICESPRFMTQTAPLLGEMARTARWGAWGVLGNHDISNMRERVVPFLEDAGIAVLVNQAACVTTDHGELWLAGIDDALLGEVDLVRAFTQIPPDAASICLWHEAGLAEEAAPYGPLLQLSGHSHGGQVRLPGIGPIATPKMGKRYVAGRFQVDDMELYVSSGIGVYRPPVRFNCPPELTIIRLIE